MNKLWKQTMALFLAFALVFGTLVPVVAWAEEPANVEEPSVEASEPEAPLEEETQTEPEESRPEAETEGKETEAPEALELSEEKSPDAQGAPASGKLFTLTKRPIGGSSQEDIVIGEYDTFYKVTEECAKHQNDKTFLYIITMHGDYTIPADENVYTLQYINILLQSEEGKQYTLKRLGTRLVTYVAGECELETKNIIFDGNKDGEFTFISEGGKLTLGKGTVLQNFIDVPAYDGPAIHMVGSSTLNIEPGAVIQNNKADQMTKYSGVIYAQDTCTVNIRGGEFTNNSCDTSGGVIGSGSYTVVNISGGTFKNNTAQKVGGVINAYGTLNISGGTFEGNEAASGGVVYAKKALIQNAKFLTNTAKWGGAVFIAQEATIQNNVFTSNKTSSAGGAVYSQGATTVTDSTFVSNEAEKQGGAIYQAKGKIEVTKTTFEENGAQNGGGAIYINFNLSEQQTIKQSTFKKNAAAFGGGVYLGGNSKLNVTETKFTENEAAYGGGLATPSKYDQMEKEKSKLNLNQTEFTSNKAFEGGGIFTSVPTEVAQSSFTENKAIVHKDDDQKNPHVSGTGGAIYVSDQKTTVMNSTFEKNTAYGSGGAIGINGVTRDDQGQITAVKPDAKLEITGGTSFKSNVAGVGQGGAIYVIPYAYTDPVTSNDPILTNDLYQKLETDATTIFENNKTGSGYYTPPTNYGDFSQLQFKTNSFTDKPVVDAKLHKSLLNNYDVNYKNPNVTVLYDANDGAFAGGEKTKSEKHTIDTGEGQESKVEIVIISETPTRAGYTFVGWKGEDGKAYKAADKLTIYGNQIFTAIWEKTTSTPSIPSRDERIIVDPNGGTFSDGTTGRKTYDLKVGDTLTLPAAPTREGYKFIAWQGKSGTYQPGDVYTVKRGGEVFTAQWEEEKKPEEKPNVTPNIKTPKGTPLTRDEIAKILAGMKKTVPAIPRAGVGK